MQKAIQKAIEGGWKTHMADYVGLNRVCLSPLFWQALGKAEGWESEVAKCSSLDCVHNDEYIPEWQDNWHRFIDHLAEQRPIDDFFNNLLSK